MSFAHDALVEFHEFYGRDNPELGLELRKTLISEEYAELLAELNEDSPDLEKVYKELADLIYVCYGLDVHLGGHLDRAIEEVHRSNMTKLWTCESCLGEKFSGQRLCVQCDDTGRVVKRRYDGKILKPSTYEKADLSFVKDPQDA